MSLRPIPHWTYWRCTGCGRLATITRQQPTRCPDCDSDAWTPVKRATEETE